MSNYYIIGSTNEPNNKFVVLDESDWSVEVDESTMPNYNSESGQFSTIVTNTKKLVFIERTSGEISGYGNISPIYVSQGWSEITTALTPSDAEGDDTFSTSCSLSEDGNVLAVGSPTWDGGAGNDQGAVYIFDKNGTSWTERTTALTPSDAGAIDRFGISCALSSDGTVLAVGAYLWDGGAGNDQGAVYIFDWNGSSWTERTTALTPSDASANVRFGTSCSLSSDGTVLAVGAPYWDGTDDNNQGAVYVFDWNGSSWTERTTALTATDAGQNRLFGYSCSLSSNGNILAVGSPRNTGTNGVMYIFDWSEGSWSERTNNLVPSDAGAGDFFSGSCSLSADGTVLAVGAPYWDVIDGSDEGAVYIFDWGGSSWTERSTAITPSDSGSSDYFGVSCSLAVGGTNLAAGAYGWDGDAGVDQGAVYVYDEVSV